MLESLNAWKFLMSAVNLLILFFVLRRILFKPVTAFMEKRSQGIRDAIESAGRDQKAAAELKASLEENLKNAHVEAQKIIDEATRLTQAERARILKETAGEAEGLLTAARAEIKLEHDAMLKELRSEVSGLALAAASKVLEANVDTETNRRLVDRFLDEVGVA